MRREIEIEIEIERERERERERDPLATDVGCLKMGTSEVSRRSASVWSMMHPMVLIFNSSRSDGNPRNVTGLVSVDP